MDNQEIFRLILLFPFLKQDFTVGLFSYQWEAKLLRITYFIKLY